MMPFCIGTEGIVYWSPRIVDFLRAHLGVRDARTSGRGRRLYVTRRGSRWRRVVNEDEILQRLKKWGFEVVDPGHLTIAQQIEIAAESEVVMGPFGAGMNLLLFAPRDATVVEFKHNRIPMDINPALCRRIGQRYIAVRAKAAGTAPNLLNLDMVVAPAKVERAIEAAGISA